MHDEHESKEPSNPLFFIPLLLIALYVIYLVVTVPYKLGSEKGLAELPFKPPPKPKDEPAEVFDMKALLDPKGAKPELVALGAKVFENNCKSCHGPEGLGNGPSAANLAVKPRNFHDTNVANWKNGPAALHMYKTLDKGVGNMAAFPSLNPKQRFAVIHYIHETFTKTWPEDDVAEIAALPAPGGAVKVTLDPYKETRVPVEFAARKITQTIPTYSARPEAPHFTKGLGAELYAANCASCHGARGEGVRPREIHSIAQLRSLAWGKSLLAPDAAWATDYDAFQHILVKGMPGNVKPSFATFTEEEMKAVYDYTRSLRPE